MGDFSLFRNGADAFLAGRRRAPYVVPYRAKGNDLLSRQARNKARKLISLEDMMILWDGICQLCEKPIESLAQASRDHIMPVSRGGTSVFENLQLAHRSCNTDKGSRLMEDLEENEFDDELEEIQMQITDATFKIALAKSEASLVLVDYWAEWCSPCVQLGKVLENLTQERGDVDIFKVNVDENPVLAQGKTSIPYLEFYKDGELVDTYVGALSKRQLIAMVDKLK